MFRHSSMALQPVVGRWPLLQFRNHFSQSVGLLGRVISPSQGRYLHTGQHNHRIKAHTDIHALSWIRTHDPSVRASENSSCFRPRCLCVRRILGVRQQTTEVLCRVYYFSNIIMVNTSRGNKMRGKCSMRLKKLINLYKI
jgi:hypothetical protein